MEEENESGYLFNDGKIINFEEIMLKNINFQWETGALRIRTTLNEVNIDFIAEIKPTKEQLETIKKLKFPSRKLFFEIVDKNNKPISYRGFDLDISEMEQQLIEFYDKRLGN